MPDNQNIGLFGFDEPVPVTLPQYNWLGQTRPLGPGEYIVNPDNSWSNEKTVTVSDPRLNGGKPSVVPSLWLRNGVPVTVSEDEASELAANSKLRFPSFSSNQAAEDFANAREKNWQYVKTGDTSSVAPLWGVNQNAFAAAQGGGLNPLFTSNLLAALQSDIGNIGRSVYDYVKTPSDVYGGKYSLDQISKLAPGYALGMASATPINALTMPENALGMFGGKLSANAPLLAQKIGQTMETFGASPESIYAKTNWFRGPDDLWRYTISDAEAQLLNKGRPMNPALQGSDVRLALSNSLRPMPEILQHPELYKAYPQLENWEVGGMPNMGYHGIAYPESQIIRLAPNSYRDMLSTLLHENQHAIQDIEEFSPGGTPREFLPESYGPDFDRLFNARDKFMDELKSYRNLTDTDRKNISEYMLNKEAGLDTHSSLFESWNKLPANMRSLGKDIYQEASRLSNIGQEAESSYNRLAGEVEARAVQEQHDLGNWSIYPPNLPGYTPFSQQIIKSGNKSSGYSLEPVDHDPFSFISVDHDPFVGASK